MDVRGSRSFKLSQPTGKRGISCDATGAFLDDIPLLKKSDGAGYSIWVPRPCDEVSREISSRYGLPIDLSSRAGGLSAIARALNAEDVALAQIATVQLGLPDPPPLSKGTPSRQALEQFVRELSWSGLLKADWDPDEHPRWPAGSPDSQGGQFAPKDEGETEGFDAGRNFVDGDVSASNGISIVTEGDDRSNLDNLVPAVEHGEDEGLFDPVVYRGYFHDEMVNYLAQYLREKGLQAATEITLEMADGSGGTRIDILVKGASTPVVGIEVKTGQDPPFTGPQLYIYPHLMMGGSVIAPYSNIHALGLPSNVPLPPIPVLLIYIRDRSSTPIGGSLSPSKMLQEYARRFGRWKKFERQLLGKEETSEMPQDELPEGYGKIVMLTHEFAGTKLASREIALAMAEMMIREVYGQEHLKTQLPLQITDKEDRWLIEGSRRGEDYPVSSAGIHEDKAVIEIRKQDCQVLNFSMMVF